ncbi:MAG: bifunctional alpha,alpha-trehalose-phosphate synthase (UDP-forming)/trehalose-phosphatase [Flavobacteriales bacterium]|nr:MAG: bifunctional alpha,alpha-trehalose-phosphate synthase (UDP-forming)/trehalose-phosphatase [Flavobacteriales bacterium]
MSRTIIVSNRLPFRFTEREGRITATPSAGGLVSSIGSYLDLRGQNGKDGGGRPVWAGATELRSRKVARHLANGEQFVNGHYDVVPITMPDTVRDRHYNGFSNDTLWPLFHYFPSLAQYDQDWFDHYRAANELFAEQLAGTLRPDDRVWVHDYHLMLLPALLRERFPDQAIAFFLHIPFPSYEVFRLLPDTWRKALLEGLLGSDLVGFQTHDHVKYFLESVQRSLGHEIDVHTVRSAAHTAEAEAFPVSIDPDRFSGMFDDTAVVKEKNLLRKNTQGRKLVLSIDRLDYTKGILQRLEAFEKMLDRAPEHRAQVTYLLNIVPSRHTISRYRDLKERIESSVSRINGKYGSMDWQPVVYQYRHLDHKLLIAMYSAADIALITPMRDGMNLVAKEYVATRRDKRGVLILSETAGAAYELGGALIVNPTDTNAIADAIETAMTMPAEEQTERMRGMQQRLVRYDVTRWADDLLSQLDSAVALRRQLQVKLMTEDQRNAVLRDLSTAPSRWLVLDHDGTLVPFAQRPEDAKPGRALLADLAVLCADERNNVAIVSGRGRDRLQEWYGALPVHLIAEHGAFVRAPGGAWTAAPARTEWKENLIEIFNQFCDRCPGALVETKETAMAWHYRGAQVELGFRRSRELVAVLSDLSRSYDFQVIEGHKVIEARSTGIDKGSAMGALLARHPAPFIMAIGDDRTDEDLFKALPVDAVSIRVGMVPSFARFNVRRHDDVLALIRQMVAVRDPIARQAV